MKNKFDYIMDFMLLFVIGCSLVFGYWNFIDGEYINQPITYQENNLQPTEKEYNNGDTIFVYWDFCKYTKEVATINVNLVDGIVYYLPTMYGLRPPGCYDKTDIITEIPESIPPGEYKMEFNVKYRVNPIKEKSYHITTKKFLIN
jgi:hypothetical protein